MSLARWALPAGALALAAVAVIPGLRVFGALAGGRLLPRAVARLSLRPE